MLHGFGTKMLVLTCDPAGPSDMITQLSLFMYCTHQTCPPLQQKQSSELYFISPQPLQFMGQHVDTNCCRIQFPSACVCFAKPCAGPSWRSVHQLHTVWGQSNSFALQQEQAIEHHVPQHSPVTTASPSYTHFLLFDPQRIGVHRSLGFNVCPLHVLFIY